MAPQKKLNWIEMLRALCVKKATSTANYRMEVKCGRNTEHPMKKWYHMLALLILASAWEFAIPHSGFAA